MKENHTILIFPGLGDGARFTQFLTRYWKEKFGVNVIVMPVGWKDQAESLEEKFNRLLPIIDTYVEEAGILSIIGVSGGGSFALNVFAQRLDEIQHFINVCGRLRVGEGVHPTIDQASKNAPAFKESVIRAEEIAKVLDLSYEERVMTVRPRFGDEIVPTATMSLEGAKDVIVPTGGHILSIAYALWFPQPIFDFLNSEE